MSDPFRARKKPIPDGTGNGTAVPGSDDAAPVESAADLQAPVGGTSAPVEQTSTAARPASADSPQDGDPHAGLPGPGAGALDNGAESLEQGSDGRAELAPRNKLDDMRKADLQALAGERGVELEDGDTRAEIIDKLEKDAGR